MCLCYGFHGTSWINSLPITQPGSHPWHGVKWNSGFRRIVVLLILNPAQELLCSQVSLHVWEIAQILQVFLLEVGLFKLKRVLYAEWGL